MAEPGSVRLVASDTFWSRLPAPAEARCAAARRAGCAAIRLGVSGLAPGEPARAAREAGIPLAGIRVAIRPDDDPGPACAHLAALTAGQSIELLLPGSGDPGRVLDHLLAACRRHAVRLVLSPHRNFTVATLAQALALLRRHPDLHLSAAWWHWHVPPILPLAAWIRHPRLAAIVLCGQRGDGSVGHLRRHPAGNRMLLHACVRHRFAGDVDLHGFGLPGDPAENLADAAGAVRAWLRAAQTFSRPAAPPPARRQHLR